MADDPGETPRYEVPIEAGHVLQFRRALGELGAVLEEGGVAPPTFLMAADHFDPDYQRRPREGEPWSESPTAQVGKVGFHAEQVFEYHRHPRAGEVLVAASRPGRTWEKEGRRAGHLRFTETITEYTTPEGEPVVTATWVSLSAERIPDRTSDR